MAFNIKIVKVRPVVPFQICDAYERRNIENHRVIGTLLGKIFFLEKKDGILYFMKMHDFQGLWTNIASR